MINIAKKDKKKFLKKEVDIDTIFDMIIKESISKQKQMKQVKPSEVRLKIKDHIEYCKAVKRFYKKLIETHKLKHNNKLAGLICSHLFSLSGILYLSYGYKKGKNKDLLEKYIYSSIESMGKILVHFTEKERLIPKKVIGQLKLKLEKKK